jgi:metal-sulfur cluster biosynthetic enzyme
MPAEPTETNIREALRQVIDPELGLNIVDLGLVYRVEIEGARVRIVMTMTSPACPLGDYLKDLVDSTIRRQVPEVQNVDVVLVSEPPWNPDMMSDDGRRQLNGDE